MAFTKEMALTKDDLTSIEEIFERGLQPIRKDVSELKKMSPN
ncbi:MAG: hypothetical protein WDN75_07475 [Bacteroidota bacterium]